MCVQLIDCHSSTYYSQYSTPVIDYLLRSISPLSPSLSPLFFIIPFSFVLFFIQPALLAACCVVAVVLCCYVIYITIGSTQLGFSRTHTHTKRCTSGRRPSPTQLGLPSIPLLQLAAIVTPGFSTNDMASIAENSQPWQANSEKNCKGERWCKPEGYPAGIYVRNSLCTKGQDTSNSDVVELVTMEKNHLKFYICGPTVYALSHLGHARAYLTLTTS